MIKKLITKITYEIRVPESRFKRMTVIILIMAMMVGMFTACSEKEQKEVVIAQQYGLAYAPVQIAKDLGYFEANMPENTTVSYAKLANTAAIREAMLSGDLDVGFMGIPPFLIGRDKGMEWKIMTGLSQSPLGLVVNDPEIRNPEDLIDNGKIALPQPGSIQHILLTMYAKKEYGQADIFDDQLISMKHPDGYQALLNDPLVKGHFTSPPYLFQEMDEDGTTMLISGEEAMGGPFTFIVGVCQSEFEEDKAAYEAVMKSIEQAMSYMKVEPEETVKLLSAAYELDADTVEDYIYGRGMIYDLELLGLGTFIDFMLEEGYLEHRVSAEEVQW